MSGRYLLDTNIVIALFGMDQVVVTRMKAAEGIFVPITVIGELCYGAEKSARRKENVDKIRSFAGASTILPCDTETSFIYGQVKNALRQSGRPIPENDIWIASVARQHRLTLVSRDEHFSHVAGLVLERW
jgi:tRNA(fMet)-specific endonuclease VapC